MQAAQADPGTAAAVAAAAPGLTAATAQAFRVDIPTAAMMVLEGMRRKEQETAQAVGGPSGSAVGFGDLGAGGGSASASSSSLNVDAMVGNVLGSPTAGLGQSQNTFQKVPGFAQGGLVQLAAGGLAKPVMSPSSISSMGRQAHFGARNVTPPRGSHLSAINVPAVRAPGAHLINSTVSGRVDRIPMRARTGSFVIPADVVSGLGEGNTMAGAKMWGDLLTRSITGGAVAGMRRPSAPSVNPMLRRGMSGPGSRVPSPPRVQIAPPQKVPFQDLPVRSQGLPHGFQDGGAMGDDDDTTPIITAGGEMIVDPEIVAAMGGGDPQKGTDILCKSVDGIRKQVQAFQKTLPSPSK
jgi:hypothetical protein